VAVVFATQIQLTSLFGAGSHDMEVPQLVVLVLALEKETAASSVVGNKNVLQLARLRKKSTVMLRMLGKSKCVLH